jgi:hypothetical protein
MLAARISVGIAAWNVGTGRQMRVILLDHATWASIGVALIGIPAAFVNIGVCTILVVAQNVGRIVAEQHAVRWANVRGAATFQISACLQVQVIITRNVLTVYIVSQ